VIGGRVHQKKVEERSQFSGETVYLGKEGLISILSKGGKSFHFFERGNKEPRKRGGGGKGGG